jgi:hypothetical protein
MMKIMKYIKYLLLTVYIVQNSTLGPIVEPEVTERSVYENVASVPEVVAPCMKKIDLPKNFMSSQFTPCAIDPTKSSKCHYGHAHPNKHHNDSPADSSPKDESASPDLKYTPCSSEGMPEDHHHAQTESPNVTKPSHRRTKSGPEPTLKAPANESGTH